MTSNLKSALAHNTPAHAVGFYHVAIVGGASLKGKEVAEVLSERNFPSLDIKLLDDDETLGQLEATGDETNFIQSVRSEQFDKLDFVFFASDEDCTRQNWKNARHAGSSIVDLTYALEHEPGVSVRSPWVERQLGKTPVLELQPGPVVVAHPAAIVLALLLLRAQRAGKVKSAQAMVFEPASEHGQKGMDELHQQTVNLLSFQPLPKNIYATQVAFNMVSRYGDESASSLSKIEDRVRSHYEQIAGKDVPQPSLLIVQAPIFHGHAFAIHVELETAAEVSKVAEAIAGEHVSVVAAPHEAPTNVNAAGQGDIQVSVILDKSSANGFWLWAASDNLRVAAANAVECAEIMAASRPRGKIQ